MGLGNEAESAERPHFIPKVIDLVEHHVEKINHIGRADRQQMKEGEKGTYLR
jgi:hypothetical protein